MTDDLTVIATERPGAGVDDAPARVRLDRRLLLGFGLVVVYWVFETLFDAFRGGGPPSLDFLTDPYELLERLPVSVLIMAVPTLMLWRPRAEALNRRLLDRERAARGEAEAARAMMTGILESITDQFYALDQDWRFTYLNAKGEEFLGRTREELLGRSIWEEFPQTVGGFNYREYHMAVTQQRSRVFESESRIWPGRWLEIHAYPSPTGLSVYCRDVTERKKTEEALHESRERYRLMVEGSEAVFFYTHAPDHRFTYLSPSVREVLGYDPSELLGEPYDVVLAGEEVDGLLVHQWTERALATGQESPPYVARTRDREGRMVVLELVESPLVRDGEVMGIQGFARDITERLALEEQLLQAQKLDAVGRLAGGVAHDFNNMLTAIRGYVDMLGDDLEAGDPRKADVDEIARTADRAAGLTRQLLAFSRQQVLRPRVLDLNRIIRDLERMLGRLIPADIELELKLGADLGAVRADAGQIEQVLMNLVVNAEHAMPDGGRIVIATRNRELAGDPADGVPLAAAASFVELTVSDTGQGMDEATRSKIFEPFFTTRREGEGTGLGLSTVYGIIQQSGGHIAVRSEPGQGTEFTIFLPRDDEDDDNNDADDDGAVPAEPRRDARAAEGPPVRPVGETLLIVEDEPAVRNVARRLLERRGYTVLTADDGAAALELCARYEGRIHLVVTDVVMPGMSGREMVERFETCRPGTPVLFMSGYTRDEIIRRGIADDGIHFLEKPFTPATLSAKVREALDRFDSTRS